MFSDDADAGKVPWMIINGYKYTEKRKEKNN